MSTPTIWKGRSVGIGCNGGFCFPSRTFHNCTVWTAAHMVQWHHSTYTPTTNGMLMSCRDEVQKNDLPDSHRDTLP